MPIGQVSTSLPLSKRTTASRPLVSERLSTPTDPEPLVISPAQTSGDDLPAYEAPAERAAPDSRDGKRPEGPSDSLEVVLARDAAPPTYPAEPAQPRPSSSAAVRDLAPSTMSERQTRASFLSRVFTRGNRSAALRQSGSANESATLGARVAPRPVPHSPSPDLRDQEPPPSWEETVRDDMVEDWVVASAALVAGGGSDQRADHTSARSPSL